MASGYYPAGAEYDPNAPYNECSPPETELEVEVTEVMVKNGTIITNDAWYVYECEEGMTSTYLERENLDERKDWEEQNMTLYEAIGQALEEITALREAAEERQKKLEAHYGVRHNTIPGCDADDTFMMAIRKHLWDAMQRIRKLKTPEDALTGWECQEIEVCCTQD